jgi:hypothetical protein
VAATSRALTPDVLGAWLFKASPLEPSVDALVRTGFSGPSRWCVRPTYRADLVRPGQPVLLWVSGREVRTPAGLHAQGVTTGGADSSTGRLAVPVSLAPVSPPVLRTELVEHPVLSRSEVVRMPAGSNPSYLTREQLEALQNAWPQVHAGR